MIVTVSFYAPQIYLLSWLVSELVKQVGSNESFQSVR
jgi:hypothetical protein